MNELLIPKAIKVITHKKLKSAHSGLTTNFQWLFTWQDNIELGIPNTTNARDGHLSNLKNKLRNQMIKQKRKMKYIDEFFKHSILQSMIKGAQKEFLLLTLLLDIKAIYDELLSSSVVSV